MPAGTLYRGREGMWSWVAHRVTGVLIFFFLFVHVLDTALVRVSPEAYDEVVEFLADTDIHVPPPEAMEWSDGTIDSSC